MQDKYDYSAFYGSNNKQKDNWGEERKEPARMEEPVFMEERKEPARMEEPVFMEERKEPARMEKPVFMEERKERKIEDDWFVPEPVIRAPAEVKYIVMMGDSLSDRGTLNRKKLFGFIPMGYVSGLHGLSPDGRFTNGLVWSDHVITNIAHDFTIKRAVRTQRLDGADLADAIISKDKRLSSAESKSCFLENNRHATYRNVSKHWFLDNADIADAIVARDRKILQAISQKFTLNNDKFVTYQDKMWVRSYCEGGLMAHNYAWEFTINPVRFITRIMLSALKSMRNKIEKYDKANDIGYEQKAETLVIEWSGANDLITVNSKPTNRIADAAIVARTDNAKQLIASGYQHFILFNLPDLSLTPRYQQKSPEEIAHVHAVTTYFNQALQQACVQLEKDYPHCSISVFDTNTMFQHVYNHPEQYFFDADKRTIPYVKSADFVAPVDKLSPASGYIFYDEVHPSADMHALMASFFYDKLSKEYLLLEPDKAIKHPKKDPTEEELVSSFRKYYKNLLAREQSKFFKPTDSINFNCEQADLSEILNHGMNNKAKHVQKALQGLGWFDREGRPILRCNAFKNAMSAVAMGLIEHSDESEEDAMFLPAVSEQASASRP